MTQSPSAIIVVDVQNDFCPDGALAVAGGHEVVPVINAMLPEFGCKVFTQDWHPADHTSFASQHEGKSPFEMTTAATVIKCYGLTIAFRDPKVPPFVRT